MNDRLIALLLLVPSLLFAAAPGVSNDTIKLGQTAVFDGPTSALGLGMRTGLQIAIAEVNDAGGIHGRKLSLITRHDGYEPERAALNASALLKEDEVFAIIGGVGTPTAQAIIPITTAARAPFFAPFTGAGGLRTPYNPLVVNLRASYPEEMERLVKLLVDDRKLSKIACFFQDDSYGQAGLKGLEAALARRNLTVVARGSYERNHAVVRGSILDIRRGEPQAVVMVGTYKACAEFIKTARKAAMPDVVFCNISFVGTRALQAELGADGDGVIISQVVPSPNDDSYPAAVAYRAALAKYQPGATPDWISFEGYLAGKLFAKAALDAGPDLTREGLTAAVSKIKDFDLGGLKATFGENDNQGLHEVFLTQIKGDAIVALP